VAESLKRGSVSCVAILARTSGRATVGHPTEALERALYNFPKWSEYAGSLLRMPRLVHFPIWDGFRFWFVARKNLQVARSGERTNTDGKPVSNIILLSISDSDYSSLRPHLEYVSLPNHLVLHEAGGKLEFAYFPNRGLISLVVAMKDGKTAEAGIVGNEGFTGTLAAVGLSGSPLRAVVQITGDGFRVEVGALQNTFESAPHLQLMLSRYAAIQGMQVAQTAACNRLHDIEPRLARWLLMTQDRVDSGSLPITHDFLATMLGTDRPTVSLAAGVLQRKKLIQYTRGAVKIVNRNKLEDSACECYGVIQQYNGELGLK
jgi:CRP-like cAMP-binding protein